MDFEYMNILDSIQYIVDKIVEKEYATDKYKPIFKISRLEEFGEGNRVVSHKIILSIEHNGVKHSRALFPRLEYKYGYESLQDEMKWLYNSTM